jgi:hypothetical protein
MDVALHTNAPELLELRSIMRFSDNSGFVCKLAVHSRGFSAKHDFYFDQRGLRAFVDDLANMDRTLAGTAELRTPYEDNRISFEVMPTGAVRVSGELHEYTVDHQSFAFQFKTDQTCLKSFAQQLSIALALPAP